MTRQPPVSHNLLNECSVILRMVMQQCGLDVYGTQKMQHLHKFSNECNSCFNNYNQNYFKRHTNFSKSWVSVNILSAYLRAHSHAVRHAHDKSCQLPLQKSNICHCCHKHDLPVVTDVLAQLLSTRTLDGLITFADIAPSHKENEHTKSLIKLLQ